MKKWRNLFYYKSYFKDFYDKQSGKVQEKIELGLYYLQFIRHIPSKFVGSSNYPNLYYLRIKQGSNII